MTAPQNSSVASVRIAGREYPRKTVQTCKVCTSPARNEAEQLLLEGVPPAAVADRLPDGTNLSARNLADHFRNGHLPVTDAAVAAYLERIAQRGGEPAEQAVEAVADYLELTSLVVGRVAQRLVSGDVEPSVRDGLTAARLLSELDAPEAPPSYDEAEVMAAFIEYLEATKAETEPEQFQRIGQRLSDSPVLQWLHKNARKHEGIGRPTRDP